MTIYLVLTLLAVLTPSYCAFIQTPINTSICLGSTARFSCAATDVLNIVFLVDTQIVSSDNYTTSGLTTIGNMRFRNLTVVGTAANSYLITCTIIVSQGNISNRSAYLNVQGPPSAPTDLNITTCNYTATVLVWRPPPGVQSPSLLSYAVVIRNGSGATVYSETVRELQLVITTPDPCGHYEATVTPMCGNITGVHTSAVELGGPPISISHDQVHTSLVYSPSDNVTVNFSVPLSSKVCYYKMVALSAYEILLFPSVKPLPSLYKDQSTITVSLPPNKHFNFTITAYNGYGNTSTTVVISTFDVVGVSVNTSSPMGLVCLFNTGSLARGCLVYLTDTDTSVTSCRVVWRSLDTPVNMSLCPSSNGPFCTGVYSVEVYDIERDGSVSSVPALAGEIVTVITPSISCDSPSVTSSCCEPSPSKPSSGHPGDDSKTVTGIVLGSVVVSSAVVLILVMTVCVHQKRKKKIFYTPDPLTTPNAVYDIAVTCSNDNKTADNPVYGARIDASMETR